MPDEPVTTLDPSRSLILWLLDKDTSLSYTTMMKLLHTMLAQPDSSLMTRVRMAFAGDPLPQKILEKYEHWINWAITSMSFPPPAEGAVDEVDDMIEIILFGLDLFPDRIARFNISDSVLAEIRWKRHEMVAKEAIRRLHANAGLRHENLRHVHAAVLADVPFHILAIAPTDYLAWASAETFGNADEVLKLVARSKVLNIRLNHYLFRTD